jgi:pimeloyl-ACP methyl ester carboxylesterase
LAELLYQHGYSTVCVSSTFQPEFMEEASTSDLPAFPPADVHDLHVALTEIDHQLAGLYPGRFGSRALMGYSMGAFQTLFLAATAVTNQEPLVKFDRYVAIDTPVRLRYGVTNLDTFYQAALAWPAKERTSKIENTLMKVAALVQNPPTNPAALPFSAVESKFLIGLSFRLSLRDIIFSSQSRHNQGILKLPLDKSRRRAVYDEIMQYSFKDYIEKFATPYDLAKGIDMRNAAVENNATDLRDHVTELHTNQNIRVIENRNDFLLAGHDLAWIQNTFAPSQVRIFDQGGHLGNLPQPAVQQAIVDALDGLSATSQDMAEVNGKPPVKFKNQDVPQQPYRGW